MEKLQLEDIACFFTHELLVEVTSVDGKEILPVTAIQRHDGTDIIQISNTDYYPYDDNDFSIKPILREFDLTKHIIHNGVEVIPIIELFKMVAFREYDEYAHSLFTQMKLELEDNNRLRVKTGYPENTELLFTYSHGSFAFKRIEPKYEHIEVIKQLKMFQKLYEWKFDIDNLIGRGLAVSANINPYDK